MLVPILAVAKALMILKCFSIQEPELSVSTLAQRLNLSKSTVSRLLSTLAREGLMQRDEGSGRYRLGVGVVELAGIVLDTIDPRQVAYPHLVELARMCRETCTLSVLDETYVVNIERAIGSYNVSHIGWIGKRMPAHCTAAGKVLLAYAPPEKVDSLLSQPLPALTPNTITDPELLRRQISEARRKGYATALSELEPGLVAIAAPVMDHEGKAFAAVSLAGPSFRLSNDHLLSLGRYVCSAAAAISEKLGYRQRCWA